MDNTIQRINRYSADKWQQNVLRYPPDRDLSSGQCYPTFEQPGLRGYRWHRCLFSTSYTTIHWRSICHRLIKTSSAYLDIDVYGAPKTVSSLYTFTRGCSGKRTSHERKLLKLLIPGGNRFPIKKILRTIASSFPARFPFSSCYCEKWRDPGNHVGCCSIKLKSKRCWSIIWQTFPTGSSPVSPLLIIFCQKKILTSS